MIRSDEDDAKTVVRPPHDDFLTIYTLKVDGWMDAVMSDQVKVSKRAFSAKPAEAINDDVVEENRQRNSDAGCIQT